VAGGVMAGSAPCVPGVGQHLHQIAHLGSLPANPFRLPQREPTPGPE
jgi:hypothetical protein